MGKVRLLDKHTAELIAAGEVVERPSSVVKELVENCIDARATVITVEIKHGGASYIRVTDNGEGISPEDVPTAFLRHATSKIRVGEDLESISTLGFRGEALASISAVCKLDLISRTADSDEGIHYMIEGGQETVNEPIGCAVGTTIIVREMFFNTPARRKFLKSDKAEGNAIAAIIDRMALSHPEISFRFVRDGREALLTPGDGKLKSSIHAVFGREFTSGLLPVKYEYNSVRVEGFISRPINSRPNRSMQIFFINGRYVRSRTMQNALEEGCKGAVMIGKYPACVLGISLDCSAVDVNVHPAKLEVRFTDEHPIYEAVYFAIKSSLAQYDAPRDVELPHTRTVNVSPNMREYRGVQTALGGSERPRSAANCTQQLSNSYTNSEPNPPVNQNKAVRADNRSAAIMVEDRGHNAVRDPGISAVCAIPGKNRSTAMPIPSTLGQAVRGAEPEIHTTISPENRGGQTVGEEPSDAAFDSGIRAQDVDATVNDIKSQAESFILPDYRIIGEIFNTYILIESNMELIMIDKHTAHERLIFERLMKNIDNPESQLLLSPIPVTLDKKQYSAVTENLELLAKAGFEVEDFGMGTVLLRSVPSILSGEDAEGAFLEIAGKLGDRLNAVTTDHIEWIYHTISCKSAIKGGDKNVAAELAELVLTLINNPDVRYCPHGRPIYVSLKQREIEKYFGRIQS